jgi:hypothetical protein
MRRREFITLLGSTAAWPTHRSWDKLNVLPIFTLLDSSVAMAAQRAKRLRDGRHR